MMIVFLAMGCIPSFLQSSEQQVCSAVVRTCELEATEDADPYASCVEDVGEYMKGASDEERGKLLECVSAADTCGKVRGCLAGAGLKRVFSDLEGLFKGIGEMFRKDGD